LAVEVAEMSQSVLTRSSIVMVSVAAATLGGCGGAVMPCTLDQCVGDFSSLSGPYLGQRPPGMEPELFAPGFVSTGLSEINSVFSPDGGEFYFSVDVGPRFALFESRRTEAGWTTPEVLPFSRHHSAVDVAIDATGRRMFFCSNRPRVGGLHPEEDYDIWWTAREAGGPWGEPRRLPEPINSEHNEFFPSLSDDGTLYFSSAREGGLGGSDIYRARWIDGGFEAPENLGPVINTAGNDGEPAIARDRSHIVFFSSGHAREPDEGRLYVSFRDGEVWSWPVNLGPLIDRSDHSPTLSPDGRYLFFTGTRTPHDRGSPIGSYGDLLEGLAKPQNGATDIYWVDVSLLRRLGPDAGVRAVM
jgi:hypothetical protein